MSYSGGTGTSGDPYLLSTPTDLSLIGANPAAYFRLVNHIDLGSWGNWTPLCLSTPFTGSLDGNGYCIKNLTLAGSYNVGLFATISGGCTILHMGIIGAGISITYDGTHLYSGGILAGTRTAGGTVTITDVFISASFWVSSSIGYNAMFVGENLGTIPTYTRCFGICTGNVGGRVMYFENTAQSPAGCALFAATSSIYTTVFAVSPLRSELLSSFWVSKGWTLGGTWQMVDTKTCPYFSTDAILEDYRSVSAKDFTSSLLHPSLSSTTITYRGISPSSTGRRVIPTANLSTTSRAPSSPLGKKDIYFSGSGYVSGVVTINSVPASRKVYLVESKTRRVVQDTLSDASGIYQFDRVNPLLVYSVISEDYNNIYNAVIRDQVTPS